MWMCYGKDNSQIISIVLAPFYIKIRMSVSMNCKICELLFYHHHSSTDWVRIKLFCNIALYSHAYGIKRNRYGGNRGNNNKEIVKPK